MNSEQCIRFLKNPYYDQQNDEDMYQHDENYRKMIDKCYEYVHFNLLDQSDIHKFKYPKDSPILSFLSVAYFIKTNMNRVCSVFKHDKYKPQLDQQAQRSQGSQSSQQSLMYEPFLTNYRFGFIYNNGKLIPPTNFSAELKSSKKRFVVIFLTIMEKDLLTANFILYDKHQHTCERFVPFGSTQITKSLSHKIDALLIEYFEKKKVFLYVYYQPYIGCPINTRMLKKLGMNKGILCAVWGLWFINLRLKKPHIWRERLINTANELVIKQPAEFNGFIKDYLEFLLKSEIKASAEFRKKDVNPYEFIAKFVHKMV